MKKNEIIIIIILAILFGVAIVQHATNGQDDFLIKATPWFLLVVGIILILSLDLINKKVWFWLIGIYSITWGIEAVGTATGWPFGNYSYSNILGFALANTPLIIGINWIIVSLGAYALAKFVGLKKIIPLIITSAVLTLLLDIVMEPAAVKLDYWQWNTDSIPLQNYVSWFLIGLLIAYSLNKLKIKINKWVPGLIFIMLLIYFLSINIIY